MTRRLIIVFGLLLAITASAAAQDWPAKPVRIIVPFGAGSTPDIIARLIAEPLQARFGQPFVVENRPGASGNTGTDAVAKADPDGYTIGVSIGGPLAINTLLFAKLPYYPRRDLAPITQLVTQPSALAVSPQLGVRSVSELMALLAREPGRHNFGSIGIGSLSHLAMEAIAIKAKTQLVHVPYASSPQAVTALLRNDVQVACLPAIAVRPHASAQASIMLAVTTAQRSPYLPDVPTLLESGVEVEADAWNGLIAPAGTPAPIIEKLHQAVAEALQEPGLREKLAALLMEPVGSSPSAFRAKIDAETARWAPVIRAANIRVN